MNNVRKEDIRKGYFRVEATFDAGFFIGYDLVFIDANHQTHVVGQQIESPFAQYIMELINEDAIKTALVNGKPHKAGQSRADLKRVGLE